MSKLRKLLGARIKELRKSLGLSQEELGEKTGLHYTYIGGVERGERNISLENIEKIATGLDVSVVELFPSVAGRKIASEKDVLREEILSLLYDCDTEELKLFLAILLDIKKWRDSKG